MSINNMARYLSMGMKLPKLLRSASTSILICMSAMPLTAAAADYKIGFVSSLTGPASALGIPFNDGMQIARASFPEFNGRKIEVITIDDATDPTQAARAVRKLVTQDKVDVVIGTSTTPGTAAMAVIAQELQVPMIAMSMLPDNAQSVDWAVCVIPSSDLFIDVLAKRMKADGVKSVGYIGYTDSTGDMYYDALRNAAARHGLTVVSEERYNRGDTSVTGQIIRIVNKKPDAVLAGASGAPAALPYIELRKVGYKGKFYASPPVVGPAFVKVVGNAGDGVVAPAGPFIVDSELPAGSPIRKASEDYRFRYEKTFHRPPSDTFSPYSFDAYRVLLDAFKRVAPAIEPGTPEFRKALKDEIQKTREEVIGVQGVYKFSIGSMYGLDERAVTLVKLHEGRWIRDQ